MNIITLKPNESLEYMSNKIVFNKNSEEANAYETSGINKISIITTDAGPFYDDVAIAIFFDKIVFIVPLEHASYDEIYNSISESFKIDYENVIKAMSSTENEEFVIYQRNKIGEK